MNMTARTVVLMLTVLTILSACGRQDGGGDTQEPADFATAEEAAARAKSDLLAALEGAQGLDLAVDPARLRAAQPASQVVHAEVDFAGILANDSVTSLTEVATTKSHIAPFVDRGEVVAVAEVGQAEGRWRVTGLANRPVTRDLNRAGLAQPAPGAVTLYEVPNLNLMVYGVRGDQGERYHVDFAGFSLQEGVAIDALYPVLRDSATSFQRRYGDLLQKERLVR